MPPEGSGRKRNPRQFEIIIVPAEEGGKTRNLRVSVLKLWLLATGVLVFVATIVVVILLFTPARSFFPLFHPELEAKYAEEISSTQQRLKTLAEDMLVLREYNRRLRKALGEKDAGDAPSSEDVQQPATNLEASEQRSLNQEPVGEETKTTEPPPTSYDAVVVSNEGFRGAFPLLTPTEGFVTQTFDPSRNHFGIDYAAKRGTPVYAATDGYVLFSGWTYDDGNMLILSHGGGYITVYKHNQTLLQRANNFVKRGDLIALMGNTGRTSLGHHLHFEVWKDGIPQDPAEFVLSPQGIQ